MNIDAAGEERNLLGYAILEYFHVVLVEVSTRARWSRTENVTFTRLTPTRIGSCAVQTRLVRTRERASVDIVWRTSAGLLRLRIRSEGELILSFLRCFTARFVPDELGNSRFLIKNLYTSVSELASELEASLLA
jgi:hypothetical protein